MADIFSTNVLTGVVRNLKTAPRFLVNTFFPSIEEHQTEEIHFDVVNKKRRIAPFVSPLVAGKIVEGNGFTAKTFLPAYVKDKRRFMPTRAIKRSMGEPVGGNLAPADRIRILVAQDLADQVDMINRRLELMAAEALRLGQVTVQGEEYPTTVVNFGRAGAHTVVLSGGARWGQAGVNPLNLLQDWASLVLQTEGAMPTRVVMTVDVWKIFRADAEVQKRLDQFRGTSTMVRDASMDAGGTFMGIVDGFEIWVYQDWYVNDAGTEVPMLPAGTVIMGSSQIEGVQAFGAILDEESDLQPMAYFPKSWIEKDPSVRLLLTQSAPLMVPYRPNASLCATVL
jgi:hypothetical protein